MNTNNISPSDIATAAESLPINLAKIAGGESQLAASQEALAENRIQIFGKVIGDMQEDWGNTDRRELAQEHGNAVQQDARERADAQAIRHLTARDIFIVLTRAKGSQTTLQELGDIGSLPVVQEQLTTLSLAHQKELLTDIEGTIRGIAVADAMDKLGIPIYGEALTPAENDQRFDLFSQAATILEEKYASGQ